MKKYELIAEKSIEVLGRKLFKIRALVEIKRYGVKAGDEGGYIEAEKNLDHSGNAWVYGNARVYGDARVYGNARVFGNAWVYGNAWVHGNAEVSGNARVSGDAWVHGNAEVSGNARVYGDARVYGNARVFGNAWVYGNARVSGDAWVSGNARVSGAYKIMTISNMGTVQRTTTFFVCKDGKIRVNCGCFFGDLNEFREQVRRTRGGTKHEKAYLAAADLAESVLDTSVEDKDE